MLIITGSGRNGTGLFSKIFDTAHEYAVERLVRKHFPTDGHALEKDPFEPLSKRVEVMQDHLKTVDIETFRDSSNLYVSFLDALYQIDPNIRIILSVRDGRDFVRSAINRGWFNDTRYHAYGEVPGRYDPYHAKWPQMTPVERMAWLWVWKNSMAIRRLQGVPPSNWIILRLEDLTIPGPTSEKLIQKLESFVGKTANRQWLYKKENATKSFHVPPPKEWSSETHAQFHQIAGPLMSQFGYTVAND